MGETVSVLVHLFLAVIGVNSGFTLSLTPEQTKNNILKKLFQAFWFRINIFWRIIIIFSEKSFSKELRFLQPAKQACF